MMRSLSSGVAGLRAHQTRMDVIGTNIANVNTYGFKTSRVTFADIYYQTLSGGSAPTNLTGGTNPTQIGYGSAVATIDVLNGQSGLGSTDRAMDIYISGDGMIAVKDASGNLMYTRLGVLGFDSEGNLVDANGNFVMGFPMDPTTGEPVVNPDGTCDIDNLSRIQVDKEMLDQMTDISIGTNGEIIGIMPSDTEISVSSKRPPWLVDVEIDPESNITGDVKVVLEYISTTNDNMAADWIKNLECEPNSRLEGRYLFAYDGKMITATHETTGEVLRGEYRKNSTVELKNASGQTCISIETDAFNA